MTQGLYRILENERIACGFYRMILQGNTQAITAPGQFINIKLDGFFLRRPISICDFDESTITIIYKLVGEGTEAMTRLVPGTELDVLVGLGNGFDPTKSGDAPLLLGGGAGSAPMYLLARRLVEQGKQVTVVLGFNHADEVFYEKEFQALGCDTYIATADGSYGTAGFVTDVVKNQQFSYSYFYTCGPAPMYKAIEAIVKTSGQYSFEERMGCGFGACMGCSCKTKYGNKRICKDGPVLEREEIIW